MTTQQKIKKLNIDNAICNDRGIFDKINELVDVVNELAPALPEDEECEVVEVVSIPVAYIDDLILTKTDGKKLKIKVVEKQ